MWHSSYPETLLATAAPFSLGNPFPPSSYNYCRWSWLLHHPRMSMWPRSGQRELVLFPHHWLVSEWRQDEQPWKFHSSAQAGGTQEGEGNISFSARLSALECRSGAADSCLPIPQGTCLKGNQTEACKRGESREGVRTPNILFDQSVNTLWRQHSS